MRIYQREKLNVDAFLMCLLLDIINKLIRSSWSFGVCEMLA